MVFTQTALWYKSSCWWLLLFIFFTCILCCLVLLGINRLRCVAASLPSHPLMDLPALWWKGGSNSSARAGQVGWTNLRCQNSVEKGENRFFLLPLLLEETPDWCENSQGCAQHCKSPFLQWLFPLFWWFPFPCPLSRHHSWPLEDREVTVAQSVPEHQQNRKRRPAGDCAVCFRWREQA